MPPDPVELADIVLGRIIDAVQVRHTTGVKPPTSRQHLGALAEAVVVIRVAGAEVRSLEDNATLLPSSSTVALQGDPGGPKQREAQRGEEKTRQRTRITFQTPVNVSWNLFKKTFPCVFANTNKQRQIRQQSHRRVYQQCRVKPPQAPASHQIWGGGGGLSELPS